MSYMGQTRPRRPPPRFAYARPVLPSKRTRAGRPDRGSLGPIPDIQTYASWTWNAHEGISGAPWLWEQGFGANHEPKLVFHTVPCQFDFLFTRNCPSFPRAPARSLLGRSSATPVLRERNRAGPRRRRSPF